MSQYMFSIWSTVVMIAGGKRRRNFAFLAMRMKRVLGRNPNLQEILREAELKLGLIAV